MRIALSVIVALGLSTTASAQVNTIPLATSFYSESLGTYAPRDSQRFFLNGNDQEIFKETYKINGATQQWYLQKTDSSAYDAQDLLVDKHILNYSTSGQLISGLRQQRTYDGSGYLVELQVSTLDTLTSQWALATRATYTVDGQGRNTFVLWEAWDEGQQLWLPTSRTSYVWSNTPDPQVGQFLAEKLVTDQFNSASQMWEQTDSLLQTFNPQGYLLTSDLYFDDGNYNRRLQTWHYTNPVQPDSSELKEWVWSGGWQEGYWIKTYITYSGPTYWDWSVVTDIYWNYFGTPPGWENLERQTFTGVIGGLTWTEEREWGFNFTQWQKYRRTTYYNDAQGDRLSDTTWLWDTASSMYASDNNHLYIYDQHDRLTHRKSERWDTTSNSWGKWLDRYHYYEFPTGTNRIVATPTCLILPNPTAANLTIRRLTGFESELSWVMIDAVGRIVQSGALPPGQPTARLSTGGLATGSYLMLVRQGTSAQAHRFVKH